MTPPRISVTVTCYDLGRYLAEALDSVFAQTWQDFEVLINDDGSTEPETVRVLDALERERVTVYRTAHRGVPGARNFLTEKARGELLCAFDADDRLHPEFMAKTVAALDREPDVAIVSCWVRSFGEEEGIWRQDRADLAALLAECTLLGPSLVRRQAVVAAGGYDEALVRGDEDWDLFIRLVRAGHRAVIVPEVLYEHRRRQGSLTDLCTRGEVHLDLQRYLFRKHRDAYLEHFDEVMAWKDRDAAALRRENERVERELAGEELTAELARTRARVDALLASKSWRLTAPLRKVYDLLQGRAGPEEKLLARERELLDLRQRQRDLYQVKWSRERRAGGVDWRDLRRTKPLSDTWGLDRGLPLDRYYIERFLDRHRADVRGRVLEIKDPGYTRMFGDGRVAASEVLALEPGEHATLVGDLTDPRTLPADAFDCFLLTQTLHLVYDAGAALRQAWRALKPGGVLLATLPSVSRVSYEDRGLDGDFWRFTAASARRLFAEHFPGAAEVTGFGNVLACAAFLYGLAPHELTAAELDETDPYFPLVYGVRAVKPGSVTVGEPERRAVVLAYHRVAAGGGLAPEAFRAQMEHLRARYAPRPLSELLDGSWPDRSVAVTFDDGYRDALTQASEILLELALPATFFVVGEALEDGHEHWWDRLERIFAAAELPAALPATLGGELLALPLGGPAERRAACHRAWEILHRLPWRERDAALAELAAWSGDAGGGVPTLGRGELRELARRPGHDVGAHTEHHLSLPAHPPDVQCEEMALGKARLEAVLGRPVTAFAYPFGEHDPSSVGLARELGFRCAAVVAPRPVTAASDPWRLPRYEVVTGDLETFRSRLRAAFEA